MGGETPGEKVLKERRSPRRRGRMGTSVNTNAPEPAASKMAFPVTCVAKSAPAAMAHPLTAAKSSATTATDVGSCPALHELPERHLFRRGVVHERAVGDEERVRVYRRRRAQNAEADPDVLQFHRVPRAVHPVRDADAAAHEEHAHRAYERPHEPLSSVPVVILRVRRPRAAVYPDVKQSLVHDDGSRRGGVQRRQKRS